MLQLRRTPVFALLIGLLICAAGPFRASAQLTPTQITLNNGDSYDFSARTFGQFTGGDLYLSGLTFWANNLGQRGVVDLGDLGDLDLNDVDIPTEGFTRFGVDAVVQHTYVALAQEGEEGSVIVFRVDSIDDTSVTLSFIYVTAGFDCSVVDVLASDCEALVALYEATDGPTWTDNTNWLAGPVATWFGVAVEGSRVVGMDLNNNGLVGTLPAELGNLAALRALILWGNELDGRMPLELGDLTALHSLDLGDNQLNGSIPVELGNLTALTGLWLPNNELDGEIPAELGNLTALTELWLQGNQLTGAVPSGFSNFTALEQLLLASNQLTDLPDLSSLTALQELHVEDNRFDFGDLLPNAGVATTFTYAPQAPYGEPQAVEVALGGSVTLSAPTAGTGHQYQWFFDEEPLAGATAATYQIDGASEEDLGTYVLAVTNPALPELVLRSEPIDVRLQIPVVNEQDSLALVALYTATDGANWTDNSNWLTGPVATWFGVTVEGDRVTQLQLVQNRLNGSLPDAIGDLTALRSLNLAGNRIDFPEGGIRGPLPATLGNLASLESLKLNANRIDGELPATLGQLANLTILQFDSNSLQGPIPPELGNLANLTLMQFSNNQLNGSIPETLTNLTQLTSFDLSNNDLSGPIPLALGTLTNLRSLILQGNGLEGSIPASLGDLVNLEILLLNSNNLSGSIPLELRNLTALTTLWLFGNELSGSVHPELGDLMALESLILSGNALDGTIPQELGKLTLLTQLGLSFNQLSGSIPVELGDLTSLRQLGLHRNRLSGSIPAELGNLSALEELALYGNALSGPVPPDVGDLAALTILWLHENQLTDLPDLSGLTALEELRVQDNRFDFGDLLPNTDVASSTFIYAPQSPYGEPQAVEVALGGSVTLSAPTDGTGHTYQWFFDEEPLAGATAATYQIDGASEADAGTYVLAVTNPTLPELTLRSAPVEVTLAPSPFVNTQDSLALVALYNATDGANWTTNANWLQTAVREWHGVAVEGSRVVGVDLNNNGLVGTLPAELGNLAALRALILWGNELDGRMPLELGDLTALHSLDLGDNQLNGSIPVELGNLTALTGLWLPNNELDGEIPAELGNLTALTELWLQGNQLTGAVPSGFSNFTALEQLLLASNQLTDLPDLSGLSVLETLSVEENRFDFGDLEPNAEVAATFTYAPQADVGSAQAVSVDEGGSTTLTVAVEGASNQYQWLLNENAIAGATAAAYTITEAGASDAGTYVLAVTNPVLPELTLRSAPIDVTVVERPSSITITLNRTFGDPEAATSYRLMGLPGAINVPMASVMPGAADDDWIAYHDDGSEPAALRTYDGSNTFTFRPGRGFWVLSRSTIAVSETVDAVPLDNVGTYAIPLHGGWNIISNPFDADVPWAAVQVLNLVTEPLWRFTGSFSTSASFPSAQSGEAFYFFNATDLSELRLPYPGLANGSGADPSAAAEALLTLTAVQDTTRAVVEVGLDADALPDLDAYDHAAPPSVFEAVSLRLLGPEADGRRRELAREVRPQAASQAFDLTLRGAAGIPVTLEADGLDQVTAAAVVLVSPDGRARYDLRATPRVTLHPAAVATRWTLLMGDAGAVAEAERAFVPDRIDLQGAYPNPLRTTVRIRYGLPEALTVRLAVYDLLGRRVRLLEAAPREAGYHEVTWDGRDDAGRPLASGLYLYRLEAGDVQQSRTLLVVK